MENVPASAKTNAIDTVFAEDVWNEFFPQLARFARKKLGQLPRRIADEEDIALSAINSFFNGLQAGRFRFEDRCDLWRILATIAARKTTAHQRRMFAKKRGGGYVRGESVFDEQALLGLNQVQDVSRMPEFTHQVVATCEELLACLNNENLRTTALMRMQGFSNQEIATRLNCSIARTKQRLASIRKKWSSVFETEN